MDYHNLNLSSKPFYNFKILLISLVFIYILSIAIAVYSANKFYNIFKISEESKNKIESLNNELKKAAKENSNLKERLKPINKKMVVDIAEEINSLILEKTFSWSELLEDIEKILPEEVRLLSLSTSKSEGGYLNVKISGISSKREGMLQTIEALKTNPSFKNIKPVQFQDEEKSSSIGKRFEIQFVYIPRKGMSEKNG